MDTHPESVKLGLCFWRTLPVPPMLQLVHSSHASSCYSTRVFLARTTRTAVDAACALFARLEPLLDPCAPDVHYRTANDDAAGALSKRIRPLLDLGSLAGTNFPADATACAVSESIGPLFDPGSLAGTNCPDGATACVVMTRPTTFHVQQSWD